jgi:hypothetical protein
LRPNMIRVGRAEGVDGGGRRAVFIGYLAGKSEIFYDRDLTEIKVVHLHPGQRHVGGKSGIHANTQTSTRPLQMLRPPGAQSRNA